VRTRFLLPLAALLVPAALAAQNRVDSAQVAASEAKIRVAIAFLDQTWAQTFKTLGRPYVTPRVVGYDDFVLTACGRVSGMNAYACSLDGTISYNRSFVALLMAKTARAIGTDGDMGAIFPIAHEWGHAVQHLLGLDYSSAVDRVESDADCLAGSAVAEADAEGYLQPGDLAETEYALGLVGDAPLVRGEWGKMIESINAQAPLGSVPVLTNARGDHGNARERVAAFHRGMKSGARSCVLGIPLRPGG
jgi:predicted metalloprotease